mgnify:FL=1|tara:strand:+ start:886 stop:1230 length:345 start_codon:yes stop_codon:yes gene_type:complete
MSDCIFCQIVSGQLSSTIIYEDELVLGFEDMNAQAPFHFLFIPKKHITTLNDISDLDQSIVGQLIIAASKVAKQKGFAEDGYRTIFNCNEHGGQTVFHIHLHLLGGRRLSWPPG